MDRGPARRDGRPTLAVRKRVEVWMFRGPPISSANDPVRPRQLIPDGAPPLDVPVRGRLCRQPGLTTQALTSLSGRQDLAQQSPTWVTDSGPDWFTGRPDSFIEAPAAAAGQFPVTLSQADAGEFGQVYLNFSPATQGQREQELAAFVLSRVAAANCHLGWSDAGQLILQSEQVTGITVQDPQHPKITLLATVNGQLVEFGVLVVASGGGAVVAEEFGWLPAPQQVSPPASASGGSDPVVHSQLTNELPPFSQACASDDSAALGRFEVRGVSLTGLGGAVVFDSIADLQVSTSGATRQITATVMWQLPGQASAGITKLEMAYRMSPVDLQSGKWYVNEVSAANEAVGVK